MGSRYKQMDFKEGQLVKDIKYNRYAYYIGSLYRSKTGELVGDLIQWRYAEARNPQIIEKNTHNLDYHVDDDGKVINWDGVNLIYNAYTNCPEKTDGRQIVPVDIELPPPPKPKEVNKPKEKDIYCGEGSSRPPEVALTYGIITLILSIILLPVNPVPVASIMVWIFYIIWYKS